MRILLVVPVAKSIGPMIVTLPLFPAMTDADVQDVVTAARKVKVLEYYGK